MKNKKSLQLVTSHSSGYKTSSDKINFLISDDDDDDDDMIYIYIYMQIINNRSK